MRKILKADDPNDYVRYVGAPVLHPLVGIIHYDELPPFRHCLISYGVYGLFIQQHFPDHMLYGTKSFRAKDGSVIAVAPGQLGGVEDNGERITLSGWVLMWSPTLFHGTDLEQDMPDYQFFSYFVSESLCTNPEEWQRIALLVGQMREELQKKPDSPSLRRILRAYLRLILEICLTVHQRQQLHNAGDTDLLKRFYNLLEKYYREGRQASLGLPTVSYCARELAYSPPYFGELVRKATGATAGDYIRAFVVFRGKGLLMNGYNINETSRKLGFQYPHHFTRLFKRVVGFTPTEFLER